MTYRLHIMDSDPSLKKWKKLLFDWSTIALKEINSILPIADIDIVIYRNPKFIIPETGICGYAPTASLVFISLDPENPNFTSNTQTELTATLAHELHHCMRWSGPGYGKTLREALVTEGLAQHFETRFRNETPPFYAVSLNKEKLEEMYATLTSELDILNYSHRDWFFGNETRGIPRHTGYALGYQIVDKHIKKVEKSAAELWNEPALSFQI